MSGKRNMMTAKEVKKIHFKINHVNQVTQKGENHYFNSLRCFWKGLVGVIGMPGNLFVQVSAIFNEIEISRMFTVG